MDNAHASAAHFTMMILHEILLLIHSFTRWLVLMACALTVLSSVHGWLAARGWAAIDQSTARAFMACVDVQVLLGLTLYFSVSPLARQARVDLAAAWQDPVLQFFGVIHPCLALSASVIAHATWIAARRTSDSAARHRRLALGASLSLAMLLGAVPWPFMDYGRPWLRLALLEVDR